MGSGSDWKRATKGLVDELLIETLAAAKRGVMAAGLAVAAITGNRGLAPGLVCCIGLRRCTRMHVLDIELLRVLLPSSGRDLLMISILFADDLDQLLTMAQYDVSRVARGGTARNNCCCASMWPLCDKSKSLSEED